MSDINRLLSAFDSGELLRPLPKYLNIVDLSKAISGITESPDHIPTRNSDDLAKIVGLAKHVVLVILDGFGMNVVSTAYGAGFLSSNIKTELHTVFPSTTPTVLTTYCTGLWPIQHGVPGWDLFLEEIDSVATIIKFMRRCDDTALESLGIKTSQAYPVPSMIPQMGRDISGVIPDSIAMTPYSRYWRGDTDYYGYTKVKDGIDAIINRLQKADTATFTHMYVSDIDTAAHEYGIAHDMLKEEISRIDSQLARLSESIPTDTVIVISADHGLLNSDEKIHQIEPTSELAKCLSKEPWGTGRCTIFQVSQDLGNRFEECFRQDIGEDFYLLKTDEVLDLELLGPAPVSQSTIRRLGNYFCISTGAPVINYKYPKINYEERKSLASHGGLSPDEILVPMIVVRS